MSVVAFDPLVTFTHEAANYTDADHPNLIGTLHDIECSPGHGWVVGLLTSYFGNPNTQASAHLMVDAGIVGQAVTLGKQAWHVGGPGNQLSDGVEQAGYATFTREQWLGVAAVGSAYTRPDGTVVSWTQQDNTDMSAQLELVAQTLARIHAVKGTRLAWLTDTEHRQAWDDYNSGRPAVVSGWVRHRDWTDRALSNTSHHDTGEQYPTDVLMAKAIAYAGGTPAPTPTPPKDGFLMALTDAEQTEVRDNLRWLRTQLEGGSDAFAMMNQATIGHGLAATYSHTNDLLNADHVHPAGG